MKKLWKKIAHKHGLKIQISGIDTLPSFSFLKIIKNANFCVKCLGNILKIISIHVLLIITNILKYMKADKIFKNLSENKYKTLKHLEVSMKSFLD